jgi:hypothetical protein
MSFLHVDSTVFFFIPSINWTPIHIFKWGNGRERDSGIAGPDVKITSRERIQESTPDTGRKEKRKHNKEKKRRIFWFFGFFLFFFFSFPRRK